MSKANVTVSNDDVTSASSSMTDMLGNRLLSAVKSQWISIHTPPPTIGCYLGINRKGLIQTLHYDGSAFFTETDPLTTPTITHWIPLPNKVDAK